MSRLTRFSSALWRRYLRLRMKVGWSLPARAAFETIYRRNLWGGTESVSGPGSGLQSTAALRAELPGLLQRHAIRRMLDLPCGDFHWMRTLRLDLDDYIGADIVEALILQNRQKHADRGRSFECLDLTRAPLPRADLVLCRDCLVHLSDRDIVLAIQNMRRSGSTYLLTTNFTRHPLNRDIATGDWRPLNLQLPPFGFPAPLEAIDERCTAGNGRYADKCLALWRLADLPELRA